MKHGRANDLVAFDVDGTLINSPNGWTVWEILNERFTGTAEHNRQRFAEYQAGRLSYADWVKLDVRGWQEAGATRSQLIEAFAKLKPIGYVQETLAALREAGCLLIVISGTLDLMLKSVLPEAHFDEIYANHIGFDDNDLISHWKATPFDMDGKAALLRAVAMRHGVRLDRCAYVGDSSNDLWVAQAAGFSIALNPKSDELVENSSLTIRGDDLRLIVEPVLKGLKALRP
jgi:phosphoserine phosphatase